MLFEFPPTTLLIYRQSELNVLSLQYWILISFFALFYFFPPFILRLSLYCTNHSNYTCNLSSAYIKSSQVALQTLMLNSSSELCSKEGSFLTRSVQFPAVCFVSFMRTACSRSEKDNYSCHTCDPLCLLWLLCGGCRHAPDHRVVQAVTDWQRENIIDVARVSASASISILSHCQTER